MEKKKEKNQKTQLNFQSKLILFCKICSPGYPRVFFPSKEALFQENKPNTKYSASKEHLVWWKAFRRDSLGFTLSSLVKMNPKRKLQMTQFEFIRARRKKFEVSTLCYYTFSTNALLCWLQLLNAFSAVCVPYHIPTIISAHSGRKDQLLDEISSYPYN